VHPGDGIGFEVGEAGQGGPFLVAPAQSPREVNRTVRLGGWGLVSGAEPTVITPNENAADTLNVKPR
jgi:hypothetical protein